MSPKINEQYRRSPRASFIDYSYGDYFITICTKDKKHYFGEIANGKIELSDIGKFIDEQLRVVNVFNDNILIPSYVVMPNHIHAIVCLNTTKINQLSLNDNINQRCPNPSLRANPTCQRHVPTLSMYVSSLKGVVTKFARRHGLEFAWQARYHDHLIRGNRDGNAISEYIANNVAKWDADCFYNE